MEDFRLCWAQTWVGNFGMMLFYRPILTFVGAPLPRDIANFAFVFGFSFTVGVLAFIVLLAPGKGGPLLIVGIVGKARAIIGEKPWDSR
jgi:hypothetical protein